jgi:hypothetical protein
MTDDRKTIFDSAQRVTLSQRPTTIARRRGFSSGIDVHLVHLTLGFRGTGRPLTFTYCPAR